MNEIIFIKSSMTLFYIFQEDNETVVLLNFTDSVVKHKGLHKNLASVLVTFFVHHVDEMFRSPAGFTEKLNKRVVEEKQGRVSPVQGRQQSNTCFHHTDNNVGAP